MSLGDEVLPSCRQWKVWLPTFRVVGEVCEVSSPPFTWSLCAMVPLRSVCHEGVFILPCSFILLMALLTWEWKGWNAVGCNSSFLEDRITPFFQHMGYLPLFYEVHFPSAPVTPRGSGALQIPFFGWFSELLSAKDTWDWGSLAYFLLFPIPDAGIIKPQQHLCISEIPGSSKSVSASHRLLRQQHKVTYLFPFVLISELCCKELPDFANSKGEEGGKDQIVK